jgi:hypothetical protein
MNSSRPGGNRGDGTNQQTWRCFYKGLRQRRQAMPRYLDASGPNVKTRRPDALQFLLNFNTESKMKKLLAMLVASMFAAGAAYADDVKKTDTKPAAKAEVKPAAKSDAKPAPKTDAKPAAKSDTKPAAKTDTKTETK